MNDSHEVEQSRSERRKEDRSPKDKNRTRERQRHNVKEFSSHEDGEKGSLEPLVIRRCLFISFKRTLKVLEEMSENLEGF